MSAAQIGISVATQYLADQSQPEAERYVFAYTITITNETASVCQLLDRHWVITDGSGNVEEVRGEGVVGQQPQLRPGESFRYTSGAILKTPVGTMQGAYGFVDDAGNSFQAPIPVFTLSMPNAVH